MTKKCNSCGIDKDISEYAKDRVLKTGYRGICKQCSNKNCKLYYALNKKKIATTRKKYYTLPETKIKINHYSRAKRKTDINHKIKDNLRRRINYAIKKSKKSKSSIKLTGCSIEQLRLHIENLWTDGMSWNNYGLKGWHIDHIRPCASFDLKDPEEQKKCFHYTNLQPLWAKDNLSKGSKGHK